MATLTCPLPSNINPLSPNGFMFNITKLPEVNFFCQSVNLPGISIGYPDQGTPFSMQPIPGETLTYDPLQLQFIIDEDMTNYLSIHNWLTALGFPQNYDQYTSFINGDNRNIISELARNFSDGTLTILNNSNNPIKSIKFVDVFPIALDSITFMSTSQDVQYLVGNVSFKYGYYEFV